MNLALMYITYQLKNYLPQKKRFFFILQEPSPGGTTPTLWHSNQSVHLLSLLLKSMVRFANSLESTENSYDQGSPT